MLDVFILAQAGLQPRFQPGPARLPQQTPITSPGQQSQKGEVLESEESIPEENDTQNETIQIDQELLRYQQQSIQINGNTTYPIDAIQAIIQECKQSTKGLTPDNWAALCITLRYQQDGYINTRVYSRNNEQSKELDIVEGRLVELRINGDDERLNQITTRKLEPLKNTVLNANEVQRALQLMQQLPGLSSIKGRLGRLGSDASQSSLIVKVDPKPGAFKGTINYDNYGKISAGENRTQAVLSKQSAFTTGDQWFLFSEKSWTGIPQTGSNTYSASYTNPISPTINATLSLGFSKSKPIEFDGVARDFRTNQYQITGLISKQLIDHYNQTLSIFGQYSYSRSNLYLSGKELPDVIPSLIRRPQSGYLKVGLNGTRINRHSIQSARIAFTQASAWSTPGDQIDALEQLDISPDRSRAIGGGLTSLFLLDHGIRIQTGIAAQKSLGRLVNSMRFQVGADSGLVGLPSSALGGEDGIQLTADAYIPITRLKGWQLAFKPLIGYAALASKTSSGTSRSSATVYGALLSASNPSRTISIDAGITGNILSNDQLDDAWSDWNLAQGLLLRTSIGF